MSNYPFKRVIVTGGAGFIGSSYIKQLSNIDLNTEIVNIDNLSYAASKKTLQNLDQLPRYSLINIDINDYDSIKKIIREFNPDLLINFAAESHVDNSIDSPKQFIDTNIVGTYNLLEGIRNLDKKEKILFHHVSTDEVYGDLDKNDPPFTESHQYQPSSPYSASKAASDMLVHAWGRTYGIPYLITNCSNNFGPRQHNEKFIPKIIYNAINGIEVPIYGDGKNIRDWIFVEDHIKIIFELHNKNVINQSVNIGNNCEKTNLEILHTISTILNDQFAIKLKYSFVKDRPGHDKRYAIDMTKAEALLGRKIESDFHLNMQKTIKWYIENIDWWIN
jgi:dTDP-glucose 4,6-dehydratase